MPKSPSRTSKKKKYNARFPPARIKKIMQTDEEVGKVAAAVPVIISRALELFIESLITETSKTTLIKSAKTLSTSHIKQTIETNKQFDFLRDLVANVPDHQVEDNNGDMVSHDGDSSSKKGRGRPRKLKEMKEGGRSRGESSKASSNTSEEEEEEDEDEDTETDEEGSVIAAATSSSTPFTSSAPQGFQGNSQDRLVFSSLPGMGHSGTKGILDRSQTVELSCSQPRNNLAGAGVPEHPYQQQYSSSNLPSYSAPPYPPFIPSPSQGMTNYPIPPQFHNSYPPMMPSSQHQFQAHVHQNAGSHQKSNDQQFHTQPYVTQTAMQPQPINLSYSSRTAATTANENDDYDT